MRIALVLILVATSVFAGDIERVGTIADPEIKECSGIVASRRHSDVFWVHNDGKKERLYAINRKGVTLAEFKVQGARFQDWEDIAIDAQNNLYAADTGNNDGKRAEVAVYRFVEPDPAAAQKTVAVDRQWLIRYPGEPRDCESLIVVGRNAFLISKLTRNRLAEVFTFALDDSAAPISLKPMGRLAVDSPVTAASVSSDGKRLAAISKKGAFLFDFGEGFTASGALPLRSRIPFPHESIEACDFVPDGLLIAAESRELFLLKLPAN